MYDLIWHAIKAPVWVKVLIFLTAFILLSIALIGWVFPAIAPYMPMNQGTVG